MRITSGLRHRRALVPVFLGATFLAVICVVVWWAVVRIDDRALLRETRSAHAGLEELVALVPREQDGSAIWDEAVLSVRAGDTAWMAENLVEWVGEYFGHDSVYVLDPGNEPIQGAIDGVGVPPSEYERQRRFIEPSVLRLRSQMAEAVSPGSVDSTADIQGLGVTDFVSINDEQAALVSVRPILPSSDALAQAPGTEYLHVSTQVLDSTLLGQLSRKFSLAELKSVSAETQPPRAASIAVENSSGRTVGFLTWSPEMPAKELVSSTAPVALLGLTGGFLVFGLLMARLRRASADLQTSEAHSHYLAYYDSLTGVPNRALFESRLEQALASKRQTGQGIALHYIDLDRFKNVNDTLGHPAGDALIQAAASRLKGIIRDTDTIARLGGDEFAIIQLEASDQTAAETMAAEVVEELQKPFDLEGDEGRVGASVGVAIAGEADTKPQDMMRQADIALYRAKANGRGRYEIFQSAMAETVRERRSLERELRAALNGKTAGLRLEYQPIYDAHSMLFVGAEALVRWDHPSRGVLLPDAFIGLAEERGLIDALGFWVLRTASRFALDHDLPWIAVNISPMQFGDEYLATRVLKVLSEVGLHPRRLEIEITEGLLLQNSPLVQSTLTRLRAAGVRIALDDFGTGYSSISYLRAYGVDKLKIDGSFVAQLGQGRDIDSIVKSIIGLAEAMHIKVTAEGVETPIQRDILVELGCDQLQGYLLSRPVSGIRLVALAQAMGVLRQTERGKDVA